MFLFCIISVCLDLSPCLPSYFIMLLLTSQTSFLKSEVNHSKILGGMGVLAKQVNFLFLFIWKYLHFAFTFQRTVSSLENKQVYFLGFQNVKITIFFLKSFSLQIVKYCLFSHFPLYHLLKFTPLLPFLSQFLPLGLCTIFFVLASDLHFSNFSPLLCLISYLTLPFFF